jgi:hypothetical protein
MVEIVMQSNILIAITNNDLINKKGSALTQLKPDLVL